MVYKPIYEVSVKGDVVGYVRNKTELQEKINSYIDGDGENVAFIQIEDLPEYKLCLLKKGIQTNEDEIYNKITSQGQTYYKYYAIANNGNESVYVSTLEEAESVISQLKDKDSINKDQISIVEKYDIAEKEYTPVEKCVSSLYQKKTNNRVKAVTTTAKSKTTGTNSSLKGKNTSNNKVAIGIALMKPTSGIITSRFGIRSLNYHTGLDIGAPIGTPIYAAASGTVTFTGYSGGYGNKLVINHGNGVETVYAHCTKLLVRAGTYVQQGTNIATMGSTGRSTGSHLHFEVRVNGIAQNPQNYVY